MLLFSIVRLYDDSARIPTDGVVLDIVVANTVDGCMSTNVFPAMYCVGMYVINLLVLGYMYTPVEWLNVLPSSNKSPLPFEISHCWLS